MTLLAPHRQDLQRSGLNDDTIVRARVYSAPERQVRDLLGYGVGAGMVIPYLGVNGASGGQPYVRVRLDRADKDGKRYRSPKQAQNHLYIPPMLDATQLADVRIPLFVTEGEKKALKAAQEGLLCVGLAGVWSWRTRFPDKDRGVPLPELEALVLAGRVIYVVFDSDRATNADVQRAERALAAYLAGRGAKVFRVPLAPGPHGQKVGLDDYLCAHSATELCAIEPEPIQLRGGDEAGAETAVEPRVTLTAEDGSFVWPDGAGVTLSRVTESKRGIQAEAAVAWHGRVIADGTLNLMASRSRDGLAQKAKRSARDVPWEERLDLACRQMVARLREGEPVVTLVARPRAAEQYLVRHSLAAGETTVTFGPGGSGKSLYALLLELAVTTGCALPCILRAMRTCPVLVLDWESSQAAHEARLYELCRGLGITPPQTIHYRRMSSPLADSIRVIRADVARLGVGLVRVDSLALAAGREPEGADASTHTMNALRTLGDHVTKHVIAHVAKTGIDAPGVGHVYGSVFNENIPRNVFELRRATDSGDDNRLVFAVYHNKANETRRHPPFSLQFSLSPDQTPPEERIITVASAELSESPDLLGRTPLHVQITSALKNGAKTIPALAVELDAKEGSVKQAVHRMRDRGVVVQLPADKGKPNLWGLAQR